MSAPAVSRNPHYPGTPRAVAWDKGWRAMKAGLPSAAVPYGVQPGQSFRRLEWLCGWRQARESEAQP